MKYDIEFDTLAGFYDTLYSIPTRIDRHHATPQAVTGRLLTSLGDPQHKCRTVLITGSKGKGSTTIFLSSLINRAGAKVGRFVSPHLFDYRERIAVDNTIISEKELLNYGRRVFIAANEMAIEHPDEFPRFFEITTALAYVYFAEKNVDIAVFETGIGAMTDATNQHSHVLSVLTHIEDEHGDIFGSLEKIAEEKSGVIKAETPLILGDLPEIVDQFIIDRAAEVSAPVTRFRQDYTPNNSGYYQLKVGSKVWITDSMVKAKNAWIALTAFTKLGLALNEDDKVDTLNNTELPARQEVVSLKPFVVIDSAHSAESAQTLANYVKKLVKYTPRRRILMVSFSAEKNILPVFSAFPNIDKVVITCVGKRSVAPDVVAEKIKEHTNAKIRIIDDPKAALDKTQKKLKPQDVLVITGSVYLAGLASRQFQ